MTRIGPITVTNDELAKEKLEKLLSGYKLVSHRFWIMDCRSYDEYVVVHNRQQYDVWFELRFGLRAKRTA